MSGRAPAARRVRVRALAKINDGQPALLEFITERQSPRSSEATAH